MQMIKPRGWQIEALKKFEFAMDKHFLLDATPGSGKTIFAAFAALHLFEHGQIDFVLIVVPTTAIKGDRDAGFLGDWNKAGIQITRVLKDGKDAPREYRGAVITFQQLPNLISTFETWVRKGMRLFSIFDELHHASEDNSWGSATETLGRISVRILGMTGTCFRGDQRRIAFVKYDANGKAIADYSYSYRQAVTDRVCRKVEFVTDDSITEFMLNDENHSVRISEAETQDQLSGATRTVFRSDHDFLPRVMEKADDCLDQYRTWDRDAGGLVVCRPGKDDNDERHLHYISDLMGKSIGEMPEIIFHDDKDDPNAKIERFRKSDQRWISAVRKITEGVDIKRLRVLIMATRPTTELLFRQIVGRVVRVDDETRPGDATVFIAKFKQLQLWATKIAEEAEAGLKEMKAPHGGDTQAGQPRPFMSFGASHEDSGAISDFGDHYTTDEVSAAERLRSGDPQLADISITTLAHLQRKLGVIPEPAETAEPPLQIRKKKLRGDVVRKARHLAIKRNPVTPEFARVWREIGAQFGPTNADDLVDNYSIEIMRQVDAWLIATLGRESHG
jgi:superfamily II DNA or RNA helicase